MIIEVLSAKILDAVVTDVNLDYKGSITIDEEIYKKAGMKEFQKVLIVNKNNGARFETYIINGQKGSKGICINGAAARLACQKDRIIIMSFASVEENQLDKDYKPGIITLDEKNNII